MTMEYASTIDIGARKQRRGGINEDAIATAVFENHHRQTERPVGIFVLGDGVGGEDCGDVASLLATTVVRKRLTDAILGPGTDVPERFGIDAYEGTPPTSGANPAAALSEDRIRTAIQESVNAAHQHVQEFAGEIGGRPATTLVVGVYVDGCLYYGWVGDSRIYLINERHEEARQLTRDHAVTNELLEKGEIDDEVYARIHPDATAITNVVGGSAHGRPSVDVEFGSTDVYRDDIIMFTSDGLIDAFPDNRSLRDEYQQATDMEAVRESILDTLVTDDEIREIVLGADGLQEAVEQLVSFANERGGKDNLSVTLARDSDANASPDSLPFRGAATDFQEITNQETIIDPPEDDAESDSGGGSGSSRNASGSNASHGGSNASGGTAKVVSAGDGDPPKAAVTIAGDETIFEIVDGVTIGRNTGNGEHGPNIGLVIDDDEPVERNHARLELDEDGHWRVRDISATGTFVEAEGGKWTVLLSSKGAELHREHGFDPSAAVEGDLEETSRLQDGTAFTLEDPRNADPITFRFFSTLDHARNRTRWSDPTGGRPFSGFCT
ncbi:protein phosphatase 2C domain-containing protein [Halosolutus halophilus]|uniref:protein phosphatase 2C domain-containing protein n=1 Tax=Halosolutus halophilus TaxID=1552990 RepID=UPI0022351E5A|nr:protein phosphatase 2C domain-containing protein [Halosolutus halophilus]